MASKISLFVLFFIVCAFCVLKVSIPVPHYQLQIIKNTDGDAILYRINTITGTTWIMDPHCAHEYWVKLPDYPSEKTFGKLK